MRTIPYKAALIYKGKPKHEASRAKPPDRQNGKTARQSSRVRELHAFAMQDSIAGAGRKIRYKMNATS